MFCCVSNACSCVTAGNCGATYSDSDRAILVIEVADAVVTVRFTLSQSLWCGNRLRRWLPSFSRTEYQLPVFPGLTSH